MSQIFRTHQHRPENSHDNFTDSVIKIINSQGRPVTCDANNNLVAGSNIVPAGSDNSFFGCGAGSAGPGSSCVAVGSTVMPVNQGGENIGIGHFSLEANTDGFGNVGVGTRALTANTTGFFNVAVGNSALRANTTGFVNQAFGQQALQSNTTGNNNVAMGEVAMGANTTGENNVGVGRLALGSNVDGDRKSVV